MCLKRIESEVTFEGMESPLLPVIPETSVFPAARAASNPAVSSHGTPENRMGWNLTKWKKKRTSPMKRSSRDLQERDCRGTGKGDYAPWEEERESETPTRSGDGSSKRQGKRQVRTYAKAASSGSRTEPYSHKGKGLGKSPSSELMVQKCCWKRKAEN